MQFLNKIEAMSRGSLILDENVNFLAPELAKRNIRSALPMPGMTDEQIAEKMAMHKLFVTNNSKHFLQLALEYEIGLIAIENLSKDPKLLANIISSAITSLGLWSVTKPFIVTFKDNKPELKHLHD